MMADDIQARIKAQGDIVRKLKEEKADKAKVSFSVVSGSYWW